MFVLVLNVMLQHSTLVHQNAMRWYSTWYVFLLCRYFRKLLTHVRWETVNLHDVYELIQRHALFRTSEYCVFHMLQVLQSHNLLWTYYAATLDQVRRKDQSTDW